MDRMISMIINTVMRQFVSRGINAGLNQASKIGKRGKKARSDGNTEPHPTSEKRTDDDHG